MTYKAVCNDCLHLFQTDIYKEFELRHNDEINCDCGGQYCGCELCLSVHKEYLLSTKHKGFEFVFKHAAQPRAPSDLCK